MSANHFTISALYNDNFASRQKLGGDDQSTFIVNPFWPKVSRRCYERNSLRFQ